MHYVPHANMDHLLINPYGFDLRTLDHKLPKGARTFDEKNFLAEPNHRMTGTLQYSLYGLRWICFHVLLLLLLFLFVRDWLSPKLLYGFSDISVILMHWRIYFRPVKVLWWIVLRIRTWFSWNHCIAINWFREMFIGHCMKCVIIRFKNCWNHIWLFIWMCQSIMFKSVIFFFFYTRSIQDEQ